jgi:hypothetical protein
MIGPEELALVLQEHGASTALMRVGRQPDFDTEKIAALKGTFTRPLPPEALAPRAPILILPGRIFPIGNTPHSSPGTGVAGISRPGGCRRRTTARRRSC